MSNISLSLEKLTEQIKQELSHNEHLASYSLKARVYGNGIVQIQGIVDVLEEKMQAEELVWNIPGVKKIENNITVCTDGEIDDHDVAFEVGEEFHANPDIPATVGVKVNGGEVQLVGRVNSYNEAQEALETSAKARGVREVISRLKLNDSFDDASLNNLVQAAFMAEPELIPGRVKTLTRNGVVSLFGKLPENQAVLALETVTKVPGVKQIKNLMNQQPTEQDLYQIDNQLRLEE
jgi:hyperosmotically inducible periplasmic protein